MQYDTGINCIAYAFEIDEWLAPPTDYNEATNDMTLDGLSDYFLNWGLQEVYTYGARFSSIVSYSAAIDTNAYRTVFRVGFNDIDGDGVVDDGEERDFHWWYQTNDGRWAEKPGADAAAYTDISAGGNPSSITWIVTSNGVTYSYNSPCIYYAVNYRGTL